MMKDSLRKQVLIFMSSINLNKFITLSGIHITDINRALKGTKSDTMANFIWANQKRLIITTNKAVFMLDLNIIEKYIKNVNVVDSEDVMATKLPQSKSYIKILGILYIIEDINAPISFKIVEYILQSTYIFNDVVLTSKSRVIKASPKLDMVVIWIIGMYKVALRLSP